MHLLPGRPVFIYLLISILTACAGITEQFAERPADWDDRLARHQQIDGWDIKARLGVQTETEGGSFDVFWQQQGDTYDIRLIAPMGQGAVQINGDPEGVTIALADGQTEYSRNADQLFASMTGLPLPVTGLQDWLRGMPMQNRHIDHISWNEHGQLYKLEQGGGQVEMGRYKVVNGYELPHAFYIGRADRPELSVRLLVRVWQLAQ